MNNAKVFSNYAIESNKLNKAIEKAVTALKGGSDQIQSVLMNIAANLEHGNVDQLTTLIKALSTEGPANKVILGSHARQIGTYMSAVFPSINWNKEKQCFKLAKGWQEMDFQAALVTMQGTRWDSWKAKSADAVFNPASELGAAMRKVQAILEYSQEHNIDPRLLKLAKTIASHSKDVDLVLTQLKDEKKVGNPASGKATLHKVA
jgi:hypothetical protein